LQQISTKDYDIVKFAHTFYFNDKFQTQQTAVDLSNIQSAKSESDRKTGLQIRRM